MMSGGQVVSGALAVPPSKPGCTLRISKGRRSWTELAVFHQGRHINTFQPIGPECKKDGYRDCNCLVRELLEGTLKTNKIMGIRP